MKRSLFGAIFVLLFLTACARIPEVTERASLPEQTEALSQPITENELGVIDGYDYELWKDQGETQMLLQGGGAFRCDWKNINNALFRIGRKFDCTQTWQQIGPVYVDYSAEYAPVGNSYLCVYGWTREPLVEFYVVQSWGTWRPPGAQALATVEIDGAQYDIYRTQRVNQPSIDGTQTFDQYWSVRKGKCTEAVVSVSDHFRAWEEQGLVLGKLYEVAMTVEGYQSSGTAIVHRNEIVIGEQDTPVSEEE